MVENCLNCEKKIDKKCIYFCKRCVARAGLIRRLLLLNLYIQERGCIVAE